MKWPWVSRTAYDATVDASKDRLAWAELIRRYLENSNAELRAERDALLEKYHALKLSGAEPVPPPVAAGAIAPPAPDELRELIGEVCGTDYAKRKIMLRQLALDRAAEIEDDVIRAAILQGVSADGVPT